MQTAEYNHQDFDPNNRQTQDDQLLVKFFVKPRMNDAKSKDEGRPIYDDVEYIDIKILGSRTGGACRPASFADKQRFPKHYDAFKQRVEVPTDGTPLSEWSLISRSQAEELSFYHVKTVEQLAELNDNAASKFMAINTLKTKAKAWLEQTKGNAGEAKLQAELATRDEKIASLEAKLEQVLAAQAVSAPEVAIVVEEVQKPAPRKRKRKTV